MNLNLIADSAVPSSVDAKLARESSRIFNAVRLDGETINLDLEGVRATIPLAAARVLLKALDEMGRGHAVTTVALDEEIGTQEAAALLNVSRPFVAKLLDENILPGRKVGTHRRMLVSDVLAYKSKTDGERRKALDALTAQAQEFSMGY